VALKNNHIRRLKFLEKAKAFAAFFSRGAGAMAPEESMLHQLLSLWRREGSMLH